MTVTVIVVGVTPTSVLLSGVVLQALVAAGAVVVAPPSPPPELLPPLLPPPHAVTTSTRAVARTHQRSRILSPPGSPDGRSVRTSRTSVDPNRRAGFANVQQVPRERSVKSTRSRQPGALTRSRQVAVTVPTARYTSSAFASLENDRLWPRVWQLACSLEHVANPGDFHEYRSGPLSVLLVRGDDMELRAFQNACRHRGSALCEGTGFGLTEIRCPFHRWTYDLGGRLREVPSRREFGVLAADPGDFGLIPVRVDTWGPLVFVNLRLDAEPLAEFLGAVPGDCGWARVDEFRCTAAVSIPAPCNWKTLIDGFSETYHVQGIHREMLAMCDDVNGPQRVWERHGKLRQSYGLPSPRLRDRPDDQQVWEAFVEVMGVRVGNDAQRDAGPAPEVPSGGTVRGAIAGVVRARGVDAGHDWFASLDDGLLLDMSQYNLFPNVTVL